MIHVLPKNGAKALLMPLFWSICIGLLGPMSFSIPFLSVPFIIQNLAFVLVAMHLGVEGALMMAGWFLLEGISGFPFFSHGRSGIGMLMGPSGGYLLGYVLAAYASAYLAQRFPYLRGKVLALISGLFAILLSGWIHLSFWVGMGPAFFQGIVPFVAWDLIKACIGVAFLHRLEKVPTTPKHLS